jgi:formamidopyrimidine-DNA glycosylase
MPELPEVHTISQDLNKHVSGYSIKGIKVTHNYKIPNDVKKKLHNIIGTKITSADRIAKNIILKLSSNEYLVFHLAMTGRILLRSDQDGKDRWVKIVFEISRDGVSKYLNFTDMRQFGKVRVLSERELDKYSNKYGLDVVKDNVDANTFLHKLSSKKTNIKNALMDQNIISGMGNIYATDALFLAKINPKTPTQYLTLNMAKNLLAKSSEILNEGIKNRGSTLPDKMYVDIFGNSGSQQEHFKIYGKRICPVCKSQVQFEKINGRGTYFCPTCQPQVVPNNKTLLRLKENKKQKSMF